MIITQQQVPWICHIVVFETLNHLHLHIPWQNISDPAEKKKKKPEMKERKVYFKT